MRREAETSESRSPPSLKITENRNI
uniref:Uncharacterized protein n=1 Tax=Rhizophora mucronata TaxID=61149 RepID=A0A2P2ML72_RHIMU